jgi:hypothetical protein
MHGQLIEKALEISRKRKRVLEKMRDAVRAGDKNAVFFLARKLTGQTDEEKRNRTDPRVN